MIKETKDYLIPNLGVFNIVNIFEKKKIIILKIKFCFSLFF